MRYGLPVRLLSFSCVLILSAWPALARADWRPVERMEPYSISGATGAELYASIGANGPKAGVGRVIAYTDFKLTWSRDYRESGGACTLATARPKLVITYRLPKPKGKLPPATAKLWQAFIDGVEAHERVHGEMIVDMVREIEAATIGLSVDDDPGCRKIRAVMTERLGAISTRQRQKSRDFDRVEMSNGGNVHKLILALVNGR
jgi:predicted secreted Zn-dependent protease